MSRVKTDNKLNFELHLNHICKSAAHQLNALTRLRNFIDFQERKDLVNSFVLSNFHYCNFLSIFASSKSFTKIENLHKRGVFNHA